jgi:hydroxylysine kinase
MKDEDDNLLTTAPPTFPEAEVAALARAHFGLEGKLSPLTSERDQNHLLRQADGRGVVLKIANPAEPIARTAHQCAALRHVAAKDPGLPVPRMQASRSGGDLVPLQAGGTLRVVTWLEGLPLAAAPRTLAQRRAIGQLQARLAMAMADLPAPPVEDGLLWDLQQAPRLRPLLPAIADPALRAKCEGVLDRMEDTTLTALAALPRQPIHGDLNPHNILVAPDAPDHIAGIIDFGDMGFAPRICDVAVAAAYQVDPAAASESLGAFLAGVEARAPFTPAERALLPDLIAARMVATLAIASWRAARYPENAAYILRNLPSAEAGLGALLALPETVFLSPARG